jgi:hypothetical protein
MRWFGVALLACLALPATATAARVELRAGAVLGDNELTYTAGADEVNNLNMYRVAGEPGGSVWIVTDREAPPTDRVPPCQSWPQGEPPGQSSSCLDDHVASIVVDLGDRDDFAPVDAGFYPVYIPVSVYGGPGRDRISMHSDAGNVLDGGPGNDVIVSERWDGFSPNWRGGADTVNGGDGDDEIHTSDDRRDVVSCGPGVDEVFADYLDAVGSDCENTNGGEPYPRDLWVRPDGRPVGVTINGSKPYTNDPDVTLAVLRPPRATALLISDDGFSTWYTTPPSDDERYRFRLRSSGDQRLPITVYVRFEGPLRALRTFWDDIVLDQRRPVVLGARLFDRSRGACVVQRRGCVRIALKAHDSNSGVRVAQFARARRHPWPPVAFRSHLALRRAPRWVRVRDRAGNVSRWHRVTAPAAAI